MNYLNAGYGLKSWLLTLDHKRVAWLYFISITGFFFLGGAAATLVRLELITPAGDLLSSDAYNQMFSLHGIVMVWFFLIPSIPATMGNFLLPLMLGARDMAFPRLNLMSWYVFILGGAFTLTAVIAGGIDTGWTFYTAATGVFIVGFSSILTGINFIVTTHKMRAPGLTWFRLPLFVWAQYATSLIMVLATPVLSITLVLLGVERAFGIGIFDPALGGDPILFEHLFWFYSHPAVYIMLLPAMGVVSEVIACFAHKRIFGYKVMAFSILAIALFGFLVWGHHMFVSGQSIYAGVAFSLLSFLVSVPSALKIFNWLATLYKGHIRFDAPMLFALSFIGLFLIGGLTGVFVATLALDIQMHDTYFVVAHFHYIMVGGMVSAYMAEMWARVSAIIVFAGFNLTFFPQFILGWAGMPRRYHAYAEEFQLLNVFSSAGAGMLAVGYLLPLLYLLWSLRYGARAGGNPWDARGLE